MMMSLPDAARLLNVDPQTVREHLNCKKIGRRVVVPSDEVLALIGRPCGRTLAWEAMRLWDVNERRPLCDDKADLLASTVSGFLLENPAGDVKSDDFVRYATVNTPVGGGEIGNKLRIDIYVEAALRRLI